MSIRNLCPLCFLGVTSTQIPSFLCRAWTPAGSPGRSFRPRRKKHRRRGAPGSLRGAPGSTPRPDPGAEHLRSVCGAQRGPRSPGPPRPAPAPPGGQCAAGGGRAGAGRGERSHQRQLSHLAGNKALPMLPQPTARPPRERPPTAGAPPAGGRAE